MFILYFNHQESREFWVEPVEGGRDQTEPTDLWSPAGKLHLLKRTTCTLPRTVGRASLSRKTSSCEALCWKRRRTSPSSCLSWTSWRTCMKIKKLNTKGKRPSLPSAYVSRNPTRYVFTEKQKTWRGRSWNTSRTPVRFRRYSESVFYFK